MMQRDPSSPTAVEQGFGQVPCPPSTNGSTSGRNEAQGNGGVFGGKGPSMPNVGMQDLGGSCNTGMSPKPSKQATRPIQTKEIRVGSV